MVEETKKKRILLEEAVYAVFKGLGLRNELDGGNRDKPKKEKKKPKKKKLDVRPSPLPPISPYE